MNVRQKLSLAALCLTFPVMASAQEAAPAFEFKPYGFLSLSYAMMDGTFAYPEYAGKISSEDGNTNSISARQSRIGFMLNNADGGISGAKLNGRVEFDFMGNAATTTTSTTSEGGETITSKSTTTPASWDSALPRLRYAYATAVWAAGPGKLTVLAGQTDGLVAPLHPELGSHLALPTFMLAGNLTRRAPQLRVGYALPAGALVDLSAEVAALNGVDKGGVFVSAGNASGMPEFEARLQAVVKPMTDVKATVGVAYHTGTKTYDIGTANEDDYQTSLIGVDVNADVTKYLNVRGEWFTGKGTDETYTGAFAATTGTGATRELNETTGFWVQATGKIFPALWVMAGYGQTAFDDADDTYTMLNVGLLSNLSKNWRVGLEYTGSTFDDGTDKISGSEIALSSRFTF